MRPTRSSTVLASSSSRPVRRDERCRSVSSTERVCQWLMRKISLSRKNSHPRPTFLAYSRRNDPLDRGAALALRSSPMANTRLFQTILCPVDFSDHSRQALSYAALLASRSDGRLVVIFVEDPLLAAAAAVKYDEKTLFDKARKELRRLAERAIGPYGTVGELGDPRRRSRATPRGNRIDGPTPRLRRDRDGRARPNRREQADVRLDDASNSRAVVTARARHPARPRNRTRPGQGVAWQARHRAHRHRPRCSPRSCGCRHRRARARHPAGAGPRR